MPQHSLPIFAAAHLRALAALERFYHALARRPLTAAVLVGVISLILAMASTAARGFPPPSVHDEFSYLLGAETFASGRLTNPTHPMWRYFESPHVLQQPSYNSKFPPANALFIAAGLALTGKPIAGVWISFAFMSVAVYWMLVAWVGEKWSLALSIAFISTCSASYWSYSYWGGAVAAGAGALLLGALYRIVERDGGWRSAALLGVALITLANSRPYEGVLISIPAAILFFRWLMRDWHRTGPRKIKAVLLPLLVVSVAGALCMGIYFNAVTGSWHVMPYVAYDKTHQTLPLFMWQSTHRSDPRLHEYVVTSFEVLNYVRMLVSDFIGLVIPGVVFVPLLLLPIAARSRRTRFALITIGWVVVGMGFATFFLPHYAAPIVGAVLIVYGGCLRWLAKLSIGERKVGRTLAIGVLALWCFTGLTSTSLAFLSRRRGSTYRQAGWAAQRQLIADTLARVGRQNLVVVTYYGSHSRNSEWVFNGSNIDASRVVWAHDLGDAANGPLLDYFRGRTQWRVEVGGDAGPYRVSRYTPLNGNSLGSQALNDQR